MEKERVGVRSRLKMRGLKNRGLIEIAEDPKRGDYVLVMSKGIERKWFIFNLPQDMWRVRCSKQEVIPAIDQFLSETIPSQLP